jgi:hypothetical protein
MEKEFPKFTIKYKEGDFHAAQETLLSRTKS